MSALRILSVAIALHAFGPGLNSAQRLPPAAIAEINRAAKVRVSFFDLTTVRLFGPRADSVSIAFQRVAASSRIEQALTSPLPLRAVRTIEVPHGTRLVNGLVIGAAVGIGLGLFAVASGGPFGVGPGSVGDVVPVFIRTTVPCAVVGAVIGVLFPRWRRVFPARD